jgi:hypothetical protein
VAGRFKLLADEHWSNAHIKAAREAGWDVARVVDVLGQATEDQDVLAYCATLPPGRLVNFLEELASEDAPFAGVLRFFAREEK